ncbi:MAG: acyl-ACP--UDP-N-acetylglucosamine O-acyltransferase [Pseudomonadota bacterium]
MSETQIHPSSVVEEGAQIGQGCQIGPFCHIGAQVRLGDGVELKSHVAIAGDTSVGAGTTIWPFASLGHRPQDLKFAGEASTLEIGERNMIREYVTMNPGTEGGGLRTQVGSDSLFMMGVHVGHDCRVGDRVVCANYANLGGHCSIGDDVVIGALAGIHQFCRVGDGAMIGGLSAVVADVVPYGTVTGERATLAGLNLVGLKRRGVDKAQINEMRAAFSDLFEGENSLKSNAEALVSRYPNNPFVLSMAEFLQADTQRRFTRP